MGVPSGPEATHAIAAYGGGVRGELCAPIAKSTLSHHLKVLREAGVTQTRQEGTRCFVTLRRGSLDTRFPGLLPALLSAALADHVGAHVTGADEDE